MGNPVNDLAGEMPHHDGGSWHAVTPRGASLLERVASDRRGAILAVDFDGTLAPIVSSPEDAAVDPRARASLLTLTEILGTVAIITGRPIAAVRQLAAIAPEARLVILGHYGDQRWSGVSGEFEESPVPAGIAPATLELRQLLAEGPRHWRGASLEDKGRAVAVHTRNAPDPQAALQDLSAPVAEIAARHGLRVEPGRLVLELRGGEIDKGNALADLVAEVGATTVVMCGDDLGDLAAFDVVDSLVASGLTGGIVVSATPEQPHIADRADVWCDGVPGVAAWLEALVRALER